MTYQSARHIKIEVASLSTRNDRRDTICARPTSSTQKVPYITFNVTRIEKVDQDSYKLRGDLTIKETTRPSSSPAPSRPGRRPVRWQGAAGRPALPGS